MKTELEKIIPKNDLIEILSILKTYFDTDIQNVLNKADIDLVDYNKALDDIFTKYFTNGESIHKNKIYKLSKNNIVIINNDLLKDKFSYLCINERKQKYENIIFLQLIRESIYLKLKHFEVDKELKENDKELGLYNNIYDYDRFLLYAYYVDFLIGKEWEFYTNINDKDWNYFKFWEIPQVRQPTMDNNDNYPSGHYSFLEHEHFNMKKHYDIIKFLTQQLQ